MSVCTKCGQPLALYECSRTETSSYAPHRPSQCIAALRTELKRKTEALHDLRSVCGKHAAALVRLGKPDHWKNHDRDDDGEGGRDCVERDQVVVLALLLRDALAEPKADTVSVNRLDLIKVLRRLGDQDGYNGDRKEHAMSLSEIESLQEWAKHWGTQVNVPLARSTAYAITRAYGLWAVAAEPKAGGPEPRDCDCSGDPHDVMCPMFGEKSPGPASPERAAAPRAAREPDECEAAAREWYERELCEPIGCRTGASCDTRKRSLAAMLRSRDSATELRVWNEALAAFKHYVVGHATHLTSCNGVCELADKAERALARAATKPGEP